MTMMRRIARKNPSQRFLVDADALPQTIDVMRTRAEPLGIDVIVSDDLERDAAAGDFFGLLVQYPGAGGRLGDPEAVIGLAHENDALAAVAADLLSLALLKPPGEMGADAV